MLTGSPIFCIVRNVFLTIRKRQKYYPLCILCYCVGVCVNFDRFSNILQMQARLSLCIYVSYLLEYITIPSPSKFFLPSRNYLLYTIRFIYIYRMRERTIFLPNIVYRSIYIRDPVLSIIFLIIISCCCCCCENIYIFIYIYIPTTHHHDLFIISCCRTTTLLYQTTVVECDAKVYSNDPEMESNHVFFQALPSTYST